MDVWFREGMSVSDFVQKVESTKYYPKEAIIAEFPPKAHEHKNPLVALAGVAAIAFVFVIYIQRQLHHCHANIKRLDFWGTMLVVSNDFS